MYQLYCLVLRVLVCEQNYPQKLFYHWQLSFSTKFETISNTLGWHRWLYMQKIHFCIFLNFNNRRRADMMQISTSLVLNGTILCQLCQIQFTRSSGKSRWWLFACSSKHIFLLYTNWKFKMEKAYLYYDSANEK